MHYLSRIGIVFAPNSGIGSVRFIGVTVAENLVAAGMIK
jgi:hypothetical protein